MPITFQRRLIVDGSSLKAKLRPGWEAVVMHNLHQIACTNTGLCVLHELHTSIHWVRIIPYPTADDNADACPTDWARAEYPQHLVRYGDGKKANPKTYSTGLGSDVIVRYTPWHFVDAATQPSTLLHELVHAAEDVHGKLYCSPMGWGFDTVAEFDAILVENIYRSERSMMLRRYHTNLTDELTTPLMTPKPAFIRLLRSFRDRMPALAQQLGEVNTSYNPLRKGETGYVGVQGDIPGSLRYG